MRRGGGRKKAGKSVRSSLRAPCPQQLPSLTQDDVDLSTSSTGQRCKKIEDGSDYREGKQGSKQASRVSKRESKRDNRRQESKRARKQAREPQARELASERTGKRASKQVSKQVRGMQEVSKR